MRRRVSAFLEPLLGGPFLEPLLEIPFSEAFLLLKPTARHLLRTLLRTFSKGVSRTLLGTLGARLRGRTATQRSKKGSGEGFWGRVLGRGSEKGACYWVLQYENVLRRGSQTGF